MTGQYDAFHYEDLRGRVRGVLITVSEAFPARQVGVVEELIDANEPGVALEMLVGMLVEARVSIAESTIEQIEGLVKEMRLSADTVQLLTDLNAT